MTKMTGLRRRQWALQGIGAGLVFGAAVLLVLVTPTVMVAAADNATADKTGSNTSDTSKTTDSTKTAASNATEVGQGSFQLGTADSTLQPGTIVRLVDKDKKKVAAAQFGKSSQMYGVVITGTNLPLTVTDAAVPNQLYIGLSGTHNVLVSTQNGAIHTGDYVTISAIDGIGMLAEGGDQVTVFGRAAENFDGKANVLGTVQLKDKAGKSAQKVTLGSIAVTIDIRDNPKEKSTKTKVPAILQRVGQAIAEKPVSPVRIYLSIGITGLCTMSAIALLYGGVRSSIVAIGRNPLSKKSIIRTLVEIILTALIILIVGLFAVYLLLKL
jgi:hypothetical protein